MAIICVYRSVFYDCHVLLKTDVEKHFTIHPGIFFKTDFRTIRMGKNDWNKQAPS